MTDVTFPQAAASAQVETQFRSLVIRAETVFYLVLILGALLIRVADLGAMPLSQMEAVRALAAHQSLQLGASVTMPDSPLLFTLQSIIFGTFGASEASARIVTAFAGVLLCIMPLLFRDILGQWRTMLAALFLAVSPVVLLASRSSSTALWALLLAIFGLWAAYRFWQLRTSLYPLLAAGCFACVIFLTDPAGYLLALVLVGAVGLALWYMQMARSEFDEDVAAEDPLPSYLSLALSVLRSAPWLLMLGAAVGTILIVSTRFMLYQPGLASVSVLLDAGLRGAVTSQAGTPIFYPLLVSIFYETTIWLLAFIAVLLVLRRDTLTFYVRFLLAWLALAILAAMIYPGASAEHAIWLTAPATLLAVELLVDVVSRVDRIAWSPSITDLDPLPIGWQAPPWWSKWLLGVIVFALLVMLGIHLQIVARGFLNVPGDTIGVAFSGLFERLSSQPFRAVSGSLVWVLMTPLFLIVGFFLTASIWGTVNSFQGLLIGLTAFAIVTGVSAGWQASVIRGDDAAELWHIRPNSRELFLLADQLEELTERETGGWQTLPIVVVTSSSSVGTEINLRWLLRDYTSVRYVVSLNDAAGAEVIIAPFTQGGEDIALGAAYVGDTFLVNQSWSLNSLQGVDLIAWWSQRRVRVQPQPLARVVLWLRQDIYDGAPFVDSTSRE